MSKKVMLLALAAISAAIFALPAVASAGTWSIHDKAGVAPTAGTPFNFTFAGGEPQKLTAGFGTISCKTVTGSGKYESGTTGTITKLTFSTCTGPFGETCTGTSPVEPAGSIAATVPMTFHNVKLEPGAGQTERHTIGILITPAGTSPPESRHYASFTCGFFKLVVSGNGIIGQVTSPTCGTVSKTSTLVFAKHASLNQQQWTQVTTSGTSYDLKSSNSGGALETAIQQSHSTITFDREVTAAC